MEWIQHTHICRQTIVQESQCVSEKIYLGKKWGKMPKLSQSKPSRCVTSRFRTMTSQQKQDRVKRAKKNENQITKSALIRLCLKSKRKKGCLFKLSHTYVNTLIIYTSDIFFDLPKNFKAGQKRREKQDPNFKAGPFCPGSIFCLPLCLSFAGQLLL